ncbi:hypothetical protein ACHHYP_20714 [Achlya hypogyna]|uniref:Uncharacterized protein n=1 Tax=Achlya hypogyna TaxID=1202772 RepID=A0A1V9YDX3_ACHHY|nr:hypothetical protein ACHHYP_20714 [Achlya hypogyna]
MPSYPSRRLSTIFEEDEPATLPFAGPWPPRRAGPSFGEVVLAKVFAFVLESFAVVTVELAKDVAVRAVLAAAGLVLIVCLHHALMW